VIVFENDRLMAQSAAARPGRKARVTMDQLNRAAVLPITHIMFPYTDGSFRAVQCEWCVGARLTWLFVYVRDLVCCSPQLC